MWRWKGLGEEWMQRFGTANRSRADVWLIVYPPKKPHLGVRLKISTKGTSAI